MYGVLLDKHKVTMAPPPLWAAPGVLGPQKIRNKCSGPDLVSGSHWPSSDRIVRVSDLLGPLGPLGPLGLLDPLGLLTPVLAQHHHLSWRRRLKSTTMDSVFKETSEHLFLSCSLTVPVYHLMVKLFYHSCAKYSGYVNVF